MDVFEGAPQAVIDHRIYKFAIAHAQTVAHPGQQVRTVAHRFHAARDGDVDVANPDGLVREHDGFQPRPAHLIDGKGGHVVR